MASRSPSVPAHEWDGLLRASFLRSATMLVGVLLGFATQLLFLSFATFSPADPSFTTAAEGPPVNWVGFPGSWLASVLLLLFGWPAWLLVPSLARQAWRLVVGRDRAGPQRRLTVGLVGLMLVGIGLAVWENIPSTALTAGRGGLVGMIAEGPFDLLLAPLSSSAALTIRSLSSLLLVLVGGTIWFRSLQVSGVVRDIWRLATTSRLSLAGGGIVPDEEDDIDTEPARGAIVEPRRPVRPIADRAAPEISEPSPAVQMVDWIMGEIRWGFMD